MSKRGVICTCLITLRDFLFSRQRVIREGREKQNIGRQRGYYRGRLVSVCAHRCMWLGWTASAKAHEMCASTHTHAYTHSYTHKHILYTQDISVRELCMAKAVVLQRHKKWQSQGTIYRCCIHVHAHTQAHACARLRAHTHTFTEQKANKSVDR